MIAATPSLKINLSPRPHREVSCLYMTFPLIDRLVRALCQTQSCWDLGFPLLSEPLSVPLLEIM